MRVISLVVPVLLPAATCFVVPGIPPLQVSGEYRVVSRPVLSRPGHRYVNMPPQLEIPKPLQRFEGLCAPILKYCLGNYRYWSKEVLNDDLAY